MEDPLQLSSTDVWRWCRAPRHLVWAACFLSQVIELKMIFFSQITVSRGAVVLKPVWLWTAGVSFESLMSFFRRPERPSSHVVWNWAGVGILWEFTNDHERKRKKPPHKTNKQLNNYYIIDDNQRNALAYLKFRSTTVQSPRGCIHD